MELISKKLKKLFLVLLITFAILLAGFLQQNENHVPASADPAKAFSYQFRDIENHPWGAEYLKKMVRMGILVGYDENGFYYSKPEKLITRAEFATLLARSMGLPEKQGTLPFADQKSIPDWARGAVIALYDKGIVKGNPSGAGKISFKPNDNISRAEIVAMITRALSSETIIIGKNPFGDVRESDWFFESVLTANNLGIVNGRTEKAFVPYGTAKRVEVMAILSRYLENDNGELPQDERLISVVKEYYEETEEVLKSGGSISRVSANITGELALGLKNEGAGLLEDIPLEEVRVRFYKIDSKVVYKSSRLAEVESTVRLEVSDRNGEAPDIYIEYIDRCYLVGENTKWKIYASDITSVDTEEQ